MSVRHLFVIGALSLTLSGCLLDQTDPAPAKQTKRPIFGHVRLEDMVVSNQGELVMLSAYFEAVNQASNTTPVTARLATPQGRDAAVHSFLSNSSRSPVCQKLKVAKSTSNTPPPAQTSPERLSVGKLGFGPALQSSLLILDEDSQHRYSAMLDADVPAGAYQIISDGTQEIAGFQEILSMPEQVAYLRINGKDFGSPAMELRPREKMELFWRDPAIENDQNIILMEMFLEDAKFVYDVGCQLGEENIPSVSGYKEWNIDAPWFSDFPTEGTVSFYFMRVHAREFGYKDGTLMDLQGRRTFYSRFPAHP